MFLTSPNSLWKGANFGASIDVLSPPTFCHQQFMCERWAKPVTSNLPAKLPRLLKEINCSVTAFVLQLDWQKEKYCFVSCLCRRLVSSPFCPSQKPYGLSYG